MGTAHPRPALIVWNVTAEEEFYKHIGQRVAALRRRRGTSQVRLAEAVGIGRSTLANLELGSRGITTWRLYLIARALGCDLEDLLPEGPERTGDQKPVPVSISMKVGRRTVNWSHTF